MGVQLRKEIFKNSLYMPYEYHTSVNSSNLISLTTEKANLVVQSGVLHALMVVNSLVTSFAITAVLILINPKVALLTFSVLASPIAHQWVSRQVACPTFPAQCHEQRIVMSRDRSRAERAGKC